MALDKLLTFCPIAQQTLEYFKIKARIEKRIDQMVANVRRQTNNKKLVNELITQLARQGLEIAHVEITNAQTDELTGELTDIMFVEVTIKLPDSVSINPLTEIDSRLINDNQLLDKGIVFALHVA